MMDRSALPRQTILMNLADGRSILPAPHSITKRQDDGIQGIRLLRIAGRCANGIAYPTTAWWTRKGGCIVAGTAAGNCYQGFPCKKISAAQESV
jgi:hypothetical protein